MSELFMNAKAMMMIVGGLVAVVGALTAFLSRKPRYLLSVPVGIAVLLYGVSMDAE